MQSPFLGKNSLGFQKEIILYMIFGLKSIVSGEK